MILKKIKGPAGKPPSVKCHKVDLMAKFITDDDYFATLKRKKGQTSVKKKTGKNKASKKIEDNISDCESDTEHFFDEASSNGENTDSEEETKVA